MPAAKREPQRALAHDDEAGVREDRETLRRLGELEPRRIDRAVVEERGRAVGPRERSGERAHALDRLARATSAATRPGSRAGRAARRGGTPGCARSGRRRGSTCSGSSRRSSSIPRRVRSGGAERRAAEHERARVADHVVAEHVVLDVHARAAGAGATGCARAPATRARAASVSAAIQLPTRVESGYGCHASPTCGGCASIHVATSRRVSSRSPARAAASTSSPYWRWKRPSRVDASGGDDASNAAERQSSRRDRERARPRAAARRPGSAAARAAAAPARAAAARRATRSACR